LDSAVRTEAVEAELDAFIFRRSRQDRAEREREEMYEASVRRDRERRREENQAAWYDFEMHMSELHASLSEEHRAKAQALSGEEFGVVDADDAQDQGDPEDGGGLVGHA
jgi:hypothetical protein